MCVCVRERERARERENVIYMSSLVAIPVESHGAIYTHKNTHTAPLT